MGIWEYVCSAALTKILETGNSDCRNSYGRGSAAFAKVDRTVRTVRLRRWPPGGETTAVEAEEVQGLIPTPVKTNACSHGGAVKSESYSYVFLTFAKIGYAVRVKVVCRIVQWISDDGTASSVSTYAAQFVHESDDGNKRILGDHDAVKNETTTFAKMVEGVKDWMSDPAVGSRIIMYSCILAENVRIYGICYGLDPGGGAFSIIIAKTLIDITIDVIYEKWESQKQISTGSQESFPGIKMDDKWYSRVFEFLKEFLLLVLKEFWDFLWMGHSHYRYFRKDVFTMKSLKLIMTKFLEFVRKRHCSAGFVIIQEILMAVMRRYLGTEFLNERGFHGSATKGKKMKKEFHFHGSATKGKKMNNNKSKKKASY